VITTLTSARVGAAPERIWRALTSPGELIRQDEHLIELIDPADGYPRVGQHVRWRYRLGSVPVVLHDRPLEVAPPARLRSAMALGLFRFDATWGLAGEPGEPDRTRVSLKLVASNLVPVVGGWLDRFAVRRLAAEHADTRLRALQKWCESDAGQC
jgi:hypothetical protein